MCAQLVVYPQRRPIFSTTLLGWLPVPYYTQQVFLPVSREQWELAIEAANSDQDFWKVFGEKLLAEFKSGTVL